MTYRGNIDSYDVLESICASMLNATDNCYFYLISKDIRPKGPQNSKDRTGELENRNGTNQPLPD